MPIVPEGQMRAARPHDQADRAARDRAHGSAPRVAAIGLQYFPKISPAKRQELFVADAGRG